MHVEVLKLLFNSYIFILLFLPFTWCGYFLIKRVSSVWGNAWLLVMSLGFYAYFNVSYLPIIALSIFFNYTMSKLIVNARTLALKKLWVTIAVALNVGTLFYYKYYDFFVVNINAIFHAEFARHHLILPLAISFFTFQQLSYIIDSYRGKIPNYSFLDYALFVAFFPPLIAGPIVTHDEIIPQFSEASRGRVQYENLSKGVMAFAFGLAKKVLLADVFGQAVQAGYAHAEGLNTTSALLVMFMYSCQIYFDFSGYCDMATGISLMFNIDITMNFNSPYRALTIADFWKRWHITLTRFFTRYVYIPMGGNRKGKIRTYINMFFVFLVSGLWHGANWTFIFWGAMHGMFALLTKMCKKWIDKWHPAFSWLLTFCFVNVAWIYFRSDSLGQANQVITAILRFDLGPIQEDILQVFFLPEFAFFSKIISIGFLGEAKLCLLLYVLFGLFALLFMKNTNERINEFRPTAWISCVSIVLLVWSVISLTSVSTFLYWNF